VVITTLPQWDLRKTLDSIQLIIDFCGSSLALTLLSLRDRLVYILASSSVSDTTTYLINTVLIKPFAAGFSKQAMKELSICPTSSPADVRVALRFTIEPHKRISSASQGATTFSVE
jgi:hypothetical protein